MQIALLLLLLHVSLDISTHSQVLILPFLHGFIVRYQRLVPGRKSFPPERSKLQKIASEKH
jgi:hypothetical protein